MFVFIASGSSAGERYPVMLAPGLAGYVWGKRHGSFVGRAILGASSTPRRPAARQSAPGRGKPSGEQSGEQRSRAASLRARRRTCGSRDRRIADGARRTAPLVPRAPFGV